MQHLPGHEPSTLWGSGQVPKFLHPLPPSPFPTPGVGYLSQPRAQGSWELGDRPREGPGLASVANQQKEAEGNPGFSSASRSLLQYPEPQPCPHVTAGNGEGLAALKRPEVSCHSPGPGAGASMPSQRVGCESACFRVAPCDAGRPDGHSTRPLPQIWLRPVPFRAPGTGKTQRPAEYHHKAQSRQPPPARPELTQEVAVRPPGGEAGKHLHGGSWAKGRIVSSTRPRHPQTSQHIEK